MKVKINTKNTKINLWVPTSLILNNFSFSIVIYILKNHNIARNYIKLSKEKKKDILKLLKKYRKQYKGLTLVEVKTKEGENILITL